MSQNGSQPLIKLDGVTKVFFTDEVETHALSGIHLQNRERRIRVDCRTIWVAASRPCCRSGPAGFADRRLVSLNNRPVAELPASERARVRNREIGFIFQSFNLIGDLTVFENVDLPLTYRRHEGGRAQAARRSGTRARRGWAIARSICPASFRAVNSSAWPWPAPSPAEPLILLADEPTGNLDSRSGRGGHGSAPRAASRRRDDLHGHARSALRTPRRPQHPFVRRPRGRRADGMAVTE